MDSKGKDVIEFVLIQVLQNYLTGDVHSTMEHPTIFSGG
jgi:hypothetical protein